MDIIEKIDQLHSATMRKWTILGLESLSDDFGYCEPYSAAEEIRRRLANGETLSERDVEAIARMYHCRVEWKE